VNTISSFFTHWKTSLCGIGAGALNQAAGGTSWKTVGVSLGIALLGLFSKDGDK
jgi:hypothetical protein